MNRSPGRKDEVTAGQVRPERFKKGLKYFVLAKSFLSVLVFPFFRASRNYHHYFNKSSERKVCKNGDIIYRCVDKSYKNCEGVNEMCG